MTVINSNISAIRAQQSITANQRNLDTAMTRLSTGLRINSAKDDAAGLAIATRMDTQIRGVSQAIRNANDGISLAQTAEGALGEVTNILQRMRELAVQSATSTNTDSDRASLDLEVQELKTELDRIGSATTFNNQKLLDGSFKNKNLQIGASSGQSISISIGSVKNSSLGMGQASFGGDVIVSGRTGAIADVDAGDIVINGQELGAIDSTSDDIGDIVEMINLSLDNVKASAFNIVVADSVGNGVAADGDIIISVTQLGATNPTAFTLGASTSLQELVDNINAAAGVLVRASIDDGGKLVLSNDTGATINLDDTASTGIATGFLTDAGQNATDYTGFIKLESTDGSSVTVERGNLGLASTGSLDDLEVIGFREVIRSTDTDAYTIVGKALTSAGIAASWAKTELKINGVEIYDENIDTNSFEGKLLAINSFSEETGVIATASYERIIDASGVTFIVGDSIMLNGTEIDVASGSVASALTLVSNINNASGTTGLSAVLNGENIILTGENVKQVNWETKAYEMTSAFDAVPVLAATAAASRTLTMTAADLTSGRQFTISFGFNTAAAATEVVATFTISNDALSADRMAALRGDMISYLVSEGAITVSADGTTDTTTVDFGAASQNPYDLITISGLAMTFTLTANMGLVDFDFVAYSAGAMGSYNGGTDGSLDTTFARFKLDSLNNTAISVNIGEGVTAGTNGLLETNVGAADYDVNDPTMGTSGGSTVSGLNVSTESSSTDALDTIDNALLSVSNMRSGLGALMNRLESTVNNLSSTVLNTADAKSRIYDADYSSETTRLTKAQVIAQAASAMLAQANQAPQQVLSLLR